MPATAPPESTLRLVSYNILDGGMGRLDPIHETLAYLRGDLMGLCEANDPQGVEYLAGKLGCEHVIAESPAGRRHVALLSRLPIERMVNLGVRIGNVQNAAMEAVVDAGGSPLRVVILHLPHGFAKEAQRVAELDRALDAVAEERLPTVLMGDFNSTAPYHPFDPADLSPRRRVELEEYGGRVDHDVVERLARAGWNDALHRARAERHHHTFTTGFPAQTVDYIWLDESLAERLADADVETGGFAPYCSDHYPVWAALRR